ncbi:MAG: hypothetical protein U5K31_00530 [Balneolaceae bacterium]|nr:hypothetical protein [Balneolaceae bacterium]
MDRLIDDITDRFLDRLPADRQYHTADELHNLELPSFLRQRLLLQVRRRLLESLKAPRTPWADLQSAEVQRRWEDYMESAAASLRLPQNHAREEIREAVEGCLELLVRPREVIPRLLFGSERKLDRSRLERRLSWLVVYVHFHSLLPRYMEKKELESLERERCASIISRADRRFCQGYEAGDWMELLDPLFELTGGRVPSGLLADFFRDKEMAHRAERMLEYGDDLDREALRGLLSGQEEAPSPAEEREREAASGSEKSAAVDPGLASAEEGNESREESLNALFAGDESGDPGEHEVPRPDAEVEPPAPAVDEEEESTPMWMRYLDPDEAEGMEHERREEEDESGDDPGAAEASRNGSGRAARLRSVLEYRRDYFVNELFGGTGGAYDRALEEIASREDWRSASRYIEQKIFKRNMVDPYSEPAVDFTDRLQSWFMNPSDDESQ